MPPQETAQVTFDIMELIPFFATAGGVFGTYIAFGKWIKAWIIKGLIDKDWLEVYLNHPETGLITLLKKEHKEELEKLKDHYREKFKDQKEYTDQECQEIKDEHVEKNTKWIRDLSGKMDTAQSTISGLQEAINGIRERLREGS